jgi:hypothetical protein
MLTDKRKPRGDVGSQSPEITLQESYFECGETTDVCTVIILVERPGY